MNSSLGIRAGMNAVGVNVLDPALPQHLEDLLPFPPGFRGGYM